MRKLDATAVPASAPTGLVLATLILLGLVWPQDIHAQGQPWQGGAAVEIEVETPDKDPLPGATLTLQYVEVDPPLGPAALETDADGRVQLFFLAPGRWRIEIEAAGYSRYLAIVRLDERRRPELTAGPIRDASAPPLRVEFGRLKNPDGPIPGVQPSGRELAERPPREERLSRSERRALERQQEAEARARRELDERPPIEAVTPAPPRPRVPTEPPVTPEPPTPAVEPPAVESPAEAAPETPPQAVPPVTAPATPEMPPTSPSPRPEPAPPTPVPPTPVPPTPAPPEATPPQSKPTQPAPPERDRPEPVTLAPAPQPQDPPPPAATPTPTPVPIAAPPVAEPTAPAPPPREIPSVPLTRPELRWFVQVGCPGCQEGEWSLATEQLTGTGPGPGRACTAAVEGLDASLRALLESDNQLERYAGPLLEPDSGRFRPIGDATARGQVLEALVPYVREESRCQLLVLLLPKGARYTGYRYEAEDGNGSAGCNAGEECPIGGATWPEHPRLIRSGDGTAIVAAFQNGGNSGRRIARLVVYFKPPTGWRPGIR